MNRHSGPGVYRLVLAGEVGDRFASLFEPLALTREAGNTVLTGPVTDQVQLLGILQHTQDLAFNLVSVERLSAFTTDEGNTSEDSAEFLPTHEVVPINEDAIPEVRQKEDHR